MVNALALNMQGKAYNIEIDAEKWAVSMDLYRLSSVLMPELQWLSWQEQLTGIPKTQVQILGLDLSIFSYPNKSCFLSVYIKKLQPS